MIDGLDYKKDYVNEYYDRYGDMPGEDTLKGTIAYEVGSYDGIQKGYDEGHAHGVEEGFGLGYDEGFDAGYEKGSSEMNMESALIGGAIALILGGVGAAFYSHIKNKKRKKQFLERYKDVPFEIQSIDEEGYPETLQLTAEEMWEVCLMRGGVV